ncbi:MAG: hypothetical protein EA376_14700 [Phycisphaeraceae bacterium]|nr:MAG: hypothetical protein EA376_14700 [Phycisphaeraceae bacterium]
MCQGKRFLERVCALAFVATLGAGSATAQFIGVDLREDKSPPSAEGLPSFPGADNVRIFNLYAMFAGPGSGAFKDPDFANMVLLAGQISPFQKDELQEGFGVNVGRNPEATFYRAPPASGGSTVGSYDAAAPGDARRDWNTFVSIGLKSHNSKDGPFFKDRTIPDQNFGFHTNEKRWGERDLSHLPPLQRSDWISGGWSAIPVAPMQGFARDLGDGTYGVLLAQLAIMNLEDDAAVGSAGVAADPVPSDPFTATMSTWYGDILDGQLIIFTQNPAGGAFQHDVYFQIPTPGALAFFTLAGAAFARRRR